MCSAGSKSEFDDFAINSLSRKFSLFYIQRLSVNANCFENWMKKRKTRER